MKNIILYSLAIHFLFMGCIDKDLPGRINHYYINEKLLLIITFLFFVSCSSLQHMFQPASSDNFIKDIDGNEYKVVKIADQWWMAENLKVTRYRNGDEIPHIISDDEWFNLNSGAYCIYNNDTSNVATYGRLYNWYAAVDDRKIAPQGWHVPTDEDWQKLVNYLGGNSLAGAKMKSRGTIEAGDGLWFEPNDGATNESGFSAVPAGARTYDTDTDVMGSYAYFWSTKNYHHWYGWHRYLYSQNTKVYRYNYYNQFGFSIRCVRD